MTDGFTAPDLPGGAAPLNGDLPAAATPTHADLPAAATPTHADLPAAAAPAADDLPDGATAATAHLLSGPALTQVVIGGIIRVHQVLGPGYVESIYRNALLVELNRRGLAVECEQRVTIWYERVVVGRHRIDLLVNGELIIELKAVSDLHSVHYAQLRSYLKATGLHTGILVNFGTRRADFRNVTLEPRDAR